MRVYDDKWYIARTGNKPFKLINYNFSGRWTVEYESGSIGYWHEGQIIPFPVEKTIREVEKEMDERWSEWEEVPVSPEHSRWYPDCDYEEYSSRRSGEYTFRCRVKLPSRVSVNDLKGTVEMRNGKPDWGTYKE
jgi:hypothetical protein